MELKEAVFRFPNRQAWRWGSLKYGWKYGLNRAQVLSAFIKKKRDYWLDTPYGVFHCPDIGSAWQFSPTWEPKIREIVGSLTNSLFVDVGANIGFYSILASKNGNMVYSLEPNPEAFQCLSDNVALNEGMGRIHFFRYAAWSENTTVGLKYDGYSDLTTVNYWRGQPIAAVTLDSLLPIPPDLVKIDAEGSEPEILKGLHGAKKIIFEAWDHSKLMECVRFLPFYEITRIDATNYLATQKSI